MESLFCTNDLLIFMRIVFFCGVYGAEEDSYLLPLGWVGFLLGDEHVVPMLAIPSPWFGLSNREVCGMPATLWACRHDDTVKYLLRRVSQGYPLPARKVFACRLRSRFDVEIFVFGSDVSVFVNVYDHGWGHGHAEARRLAALVDDASGAALVEFDSAPG